MASVPHVLVIPFPVQGHINPMLQFSKRLAFKGLKVTLVATSTINSKSVQAQATSVAIASISDGSEEETDHDGPLGARINRFQTVVSKNLINLIKKQTDSCHPFKVLVYDSMMPWALDIAHQLGLQGASFFTQSCGVSVLYYHMHEGNLKIPADGSLISVPSMSVKLRVHDLPSFIYDMDLHPAITKTVINQFSNFREVDWLFFNTIHELEDEVVNWMAGQWSIRTIGPTIPSVYTDNRLINDKDYGLNLFISNPDTCKNWLDTKTKGSVVYVSFGSIANLGEEQTAELAYGLVQSESPFLWVVRGPEESKLPKDFVSQNLGQCLVVNWCSQLEVLAHQSVGCFMTHCGWNSTLEALSLGVPLVAMPQWTDQTTNAKFIVDVWKTGVRVKVNDEKGIVMREEIEKCVKEVMEGDKGIEIKRNALKLREFAKEAVDEGGSSDKNIDKFVSSLILNT